MNKVQDIVTVQVQEIGFTDEKTYSSDCEPAVRAQSSPPPPPPPRSNQQQQMLGHQEHEAMKNPTKPRKSVSGVSTGPMGKTWSIN